MDSKLLNDAMIKEIERIVQSGKTAEVVKLKHEIAIFEKTCEKRISASVECRK